MTPLHYAVLNNKIEMTKILLTHGANVNAKNIFDMTPLNYSINDELSSILILNGGKRDEDPVL